MLWVVFLVCVLPFFCCFSKSLVRPSFDGRDRGRVSLGRLKMGLPRCRSVSPLIGSDVCSPTIQSTLLTPVYAAQHVSVGYLPFPTADFFPIPVSERPGWSHDHPDSGTVQPGWRGSVLSRFNLSCSCFVLLGIALYDFPDSSDQVSTYRNLPFDLVLLVCFPLSD